MGIYVLKYLADFADGADFFLIYFVKTIMNIPIVYFKFCLSEINEIKD